MSLRTKTLSSIGLLNAVLLAIIYGLASQVMLRGFQDAEVKRTYEKMQGIQAAMAQRMGDLGRLAGDWSISSQTYDFVRKPDQQYPQENLTDASLAEAKIELLLIVDRAGRVVYGTRFVHERKHRLPLPADMATYLRQHPTVWRHPSPASVVTGIAFLRGKPMFLASRPIVTSDGSGPIVGAVILGRLLDRDEMGPIEQLAQVSILRFPYSSLALTADFQLAKDQLPRHGDIWVQPLNNDIVGGYTVLADLSGKPGLLLGAFSPRVIYHQGLISLRYLLASILVYSFAFGIMGLLGLEHWVLARLLKLSAAVVRIGTSQDASHRVAVAGDDELGSLASEINVTLSALENFQQQLNERRLELAAILDHTAVPLVVVDDERIIERANPAAAALAGRDLALAKGMRLGEFLGCATLCDSDRQCGFEEECESCSTCAAIAETIQRGQDHNRAPALMSFVRNGSPEECHLLLSTTRFEAGGRSMVLVCLEDVTDIRRAERALGESEKRFRELADLLPDMVYEADTSFRLTYANKTALETLGYTLADLEHALLITDLIPEAEVAVARDALREAAVTGEPTMSRYDIRRADGTALPCEVHSVAVRNQDGVLIGYRGVVRDVSERKQMEEAQRLAAIGHLAAGVAHEFNNILAAMRLIAEVTLARGGSADKLIQTVLAGAELGGNICRKLSRFARPAVPKREPISIEAPIEAALAMAAQELENAEIKVQRNYQHGDTQVYGDASQLEQVFLNLTINACDAMPQGGLLTIETEYVPLGAQHEVVVTFTDTGTGISPEDLPHVFEPFFTTRRGEAEDQISGTGLGLSVSHRIVSAHGGLMTARSQVGVGATFELRLVAYEGPLEDEEEPLLEEMDEQIGEPPAPGDGQSYRILVVEDVATVRDAMAILLTQAGHHVVTAGTTDEALSAMRSSPFDLVIADLILKGGGGREVLAAARFMIDPAPVVIMTGMTDDAVIDEVMALGAKKCVRKPFSIDEVLEAVREVCAPRRV